MARPELALIKDGLNRAARTLFWAALVAVIVSFVLRLLPGITAPWWAVMSTMLVGALIQAVCSFVHRVALDPSNLPTLAPDDTPTFSEPPLDPPVPFG